MADNLINKVLNREADRQLVEQQLFLDNLLLKEEQNTWQIERQDICKI
jgi:hypothetical protein